MVEGENQFLQVVYDKDQAQFVKLGNVKFRKLSHLIDRGTAIHYSMHP